MKNGSIWIISLLILFFLIIGCTSMSNNTDSNNSTLDLKNIENETKDSPICIEQWKCLSDETKIFQLANCSFTQKLDCPLGCENNTCRVGEVCESGFKCIDEERYGLQLSSCKWESTTTCEFGCENAKCKEENNETINTSQTIEDDDDDYEEEEEEEVTVQETTTTSLTTLKMGEIHAVTVNENPYNISIYMMDAGKVILTLNNERTDWIMEDINYTYQQDTFIIEEILFQPFDGGIREIGYRVE